ncbi:uncharacterized protein LOC134790449 [Cydia splendana]|uniref:uncharacterized protein LOC134790449 n=1 Tax=Cydia splendana TaxID=1100963 RepID=UPI002142CF93
MYIRRNTAVKYCLGIALGAILYGEVIVYYIQALQWQNLQCQVGDKTCTKILFIADPQIQGELAVPPPLSYLFNWDSDRFVQMTFSRVVRHFEPEVLVYLGDLMDEGSIANTEQYSHYIKRLSDIFDNIPYPVHQIWVPGDNDIGGENEPIKWDKVKLFHKVFAQPPIVAVKDISFYRINAITHAFPKLPENETDDNFKIAVSHYPLLIRHAFIAEVNKHTHLDIFFCAHDHESKYTTQTQRFEQSKIHQFYGNEILDIGFGGDVYEIYVPTCSYRMGTSKIGYGAAVLDYNNTRLRYTVFWSPQRFLYLFGYLVLLVLGIAYTAACIVKLFCQWYCRSTSLPMYSKL